MQGKDEGKLDEKDKAAHLCRDNVDDAPKGGEEMV